MQDRFKFRIWDKFCETWLTDFAINQDGEINRFFNNEEALKRRFVLTQCTGLKDKNGKLIYEGDILGGTYADGYISYCDKCKSLQYFIPNFNCLSCEGDVHWAELVEEDGNLEIIGNIYENPELLEVSNGY